MTALSDDEWVDRVERAIAHWRARNAAFTEAASRIEVDAVHDAVVAHFDSVGNLKGLDIDPSALETYTNIELEEIITTVLQRTRAAIHTQMIDLFERYLAPNHPRFEPNVLGEPYVRMPS